VLFWRYGVPGSLEGNSQTALRMFESITEVKMKLCKLQKCHCDERTVNQILLYEDLWGTGNEGVPAIKLGISWKVVSFIAMLVESV
jgi:hypothetical protein